MTRYPFTSSELIDFEPQGFTGRPRRELFEGILGGRLMGLAQLINTKERLE